MTKKIKRRLMITGISLIAVLVGLAGAFYFYTLDYYRAEAVAVKLLENEQNVQQIDNLWIFHGEGTGDDQTTGLIFYPGGKVEPIAYAPLLEQLAQYGITSVLIDMPFNLAMFNIDAADQVYDKFPEIQRWFLAGHSLGGAMAGVYANEHPERLHGLILLGAYVTDEPVIPTLAIYGSEDEVLDQDKVLMVPNRYEIPGGNHANFGYYGVQKGDGVATLSREEQQRLTVEQMMAFIGQEREE